MRQALHHFRYSLLVCMAALGLSGQVQAGSHLWVVNELFSNADGTIQFIELHECCGSSFEVNIGGKTITGDTNGSVFVIPSNLEDITASRYLLFATQAFADFAGTPTPDYIIPDNFFSVDGDKVWYGPTFGYDSFTYVSGDLPTDGVSSIQISDFSLDLFSTGSNTPTNFAGQTATIDFDLVVPATSTWGMIVLTMFLLVAATCLIRRSQRKPEIAQ